MYLRTIEQVMIEMCSINPLLYLIELNHSSFWCFLHIISLYVQCFYPSVSSQPVMKSFTRSGHGLMLLQWIAGRGLITSITAARVLIGCCAMWAGPYWGLNHSCTIHTEIKARSVLDHIVRLEVYNRWMWWSDWGRVWWWRCNGVNSAHQPPSEQQLTHITVLSLVLG